MARFPSVGEEFGDYRITDTLGRGGMGVAFAAEQQGAQLRQASRRHRPGDVSFRWR
jgi:hypothetical protein